MGRFETSREEIFWALGLIIRARPLADLSQETLYPLISLQTRVTLKGNLSAKLKPSEASSLALFWCCITLVWVSWAQVSLCSVRS